MDEKQWETCSINPFEKYEKRQIQKLKTSTEKRNTKILLSKLETKLEENVFAYMKKKHTHTKTTLIKKQKKRGISCTALRGETFLHWLATRWQY